MNPFVAPQTDSNPSPRSWLEARPGLIVFLLALALGLGAVGWRANSRARAARQFARLEAQARGAALRGQLRQAVWALQVLGALARQNGGAIPNFQKAGADLRASWPDLATVELQPNGVVSDIVPRAGYERVIGFNVFKDPAQFPSAQAAIRRRAPTIAGPLKLYRGEPGVVMRAPIFQRARDGREFFWGFAAVSMRLTEPLARARADELDQAVQQEFGARDLTFSPAPAPPGGWIDKTKAALESLAALVVAALLWLLVNLVKSGYSLEAALTDANRRLASFGVERKQAQEDWRSAKEAAAAAQAQLKHTREALQQAESGRLDCQARLETSQRANQETVQALDARLKQAELNAHELQERLDATVRAADTAARAAQAELEEARSALHQARQTIHQLQSRPDPDALPEKEAATAQTPPEQDPAARADLEPRPDAVPNPPEQTPANLAAVGGLPAPEALAPPAVAGPEENPPPPEPPPPEPPPPEPPPQVLAQAPEPPPDKPKAGPGARRKRTRREAELDLFSSQVNPAQLRKAVNLILPLLAGQDPGAKDCLQDNRAIFQSAFSPETYAEFEQSIKKRDFDLAQDQLKKTVKKHGIT
jgi:sensor domain CHASE-containing protein